MYTNYSYPIFENKRNDFSLIEFSREINFLAASKSVIQISLASRYYMIYIKKKLMWQNDVGGDIGTLNNGLSTRVGVKFLSIYVNKMGGLFQHVSWRNLLVFYKKKLTKEK